MAQTRECWSMRGFIMEAWTGYCMEGLMALPLTGIPG